MEIALIFAIIYLLTQFGLRIFFPDRFAEAPPEAISLEAVDSTVKEGAHPILTLRNGTEMPLELASRCPMPPVEVSFLGDPESPSEPELLDRADTVLPCLPPPAVPPGEELQIDLAPWKYSLFARRGLYEVRLPQAGTGAALTARFQIQEPGPMTKLFRTLITKPFLNALIFIASIVPGRDLGISIIILTIIVKLLLYYPTQKSLKGQRELQKLQPKIEELKRKFQGDPQKLQAETMRLWKEHKINPLQSCLPTLIQFPVLIGLFYTIRDGTHLVLARHLIYPLYQHLSWTFDTEFLGLDLLQPELIVIPISLVVLQFAQMKLAFTLSERKRKASQEKEVIDIGPKEPTEKTPLTPQDIQQKVLLYGLPLMIGFFALSFPAAVSLYWGVSTIFGIGQQVVVNRKT